MGPNRIAVRVELAAGVFASQPLVFAHLADLAPAADLDAVEVIAPKGRGPRLAHLFGPDGAAAIAALLTPGDSVIACLPGAGIAPDVLAASAHLRPLGPFPGHILRAGGAG